MLACRTQTNVRTLYSLFERSAKEHNAGAVRGRADAAAFVAADGAGAADGRAALLADGNVRQGRGDGRDGRAGQGGNVDALGLAVDDLAGGVDLAEDRGAGVELVVASHRRRSSRGLRVAADRRDDQGRADESRDRAILTVVEDGAGLGDGEGESGHNGGREEAEGADGNHGELREDEVLDLVGLCLQTRCSRRAKADLANGGELEASCGGFVYSRSGNEWRVEE